MPRKTRSKDEIIQAASELFFTYGYRRVTVDEVAAELAISKKTLYKHFSSKEDLLLAVMETYHADIKAGFDEIAAAQLDFSTHLSQVITLLSQKMARIGPPQQDIRRQAPAVWQRVEELRQEVIFAELERLLQMGQAEGVLRPDIDPALHTTLLTLWMQAAANSDILSQHTLSAADIIHAMLDIYLNGVKS